MAYVPRITQLQEMSVGTYIPPKLEAADIASFVDLTMDVFKFCWSTVPKHPQLSHLPTPYVHPTQLGSELLRTTCHTVYHRTGALGPEIALMLLYVRELTKRCQWTEFLDFADNTPVLKCQRGEGGAWTQRTAFLGGMLMANKFLCDNVLSSKSWAKVTGNAPVEITEIELRFAKALDFQLWVKNDEFEEWIVTLEGLAENSRIRDHYIPRLRDMVGLKEFVASGYQMVSSTPGSVQTVFPSPLSIPNGHASLPSLTLQVPVDWRQQHSQSLPQQTRRQPMATSVLRWESNPELFLEYFNPAPDSAVDLDGFIQPVDNTSQFDFVQSQDDDLTLISPGSAISNASLSGHVTPVGIVPRSQRFVSTFLHPQQQPQQQELQQQQQQQQPQPPRPRIRHTHSQPSLPLRIHIPRVVPQPYSSTYSYRRSNVPHISTRPRSIIPPLIQAQGQPSFGLQSLPGVQTVPGYPFIQTSFAPIHACGTPLDTPMYEYPPAPVMHAAETPVCEGCEQCQLWGTGGVLAPMTLPWIYGGEVGVGWVQ
ncbi:hypothetical protein HDU85_005104 [Gaertneriomyces sp. JEL0708]|nr:hypothetical protein HDU85_005104 [Gaertneriomyces sp. JEL0708]